MTFACRRLFYILGLLNVPLGLLLFVCWLWVLKWNLLRGSLFKLLSSSPLYTLILLWRDCNEPTSGFLDFSKFYSQSFWLCCNFFQLPLKHSYHKLLGKTYEPFGPWILWVSVTFVISFQGWFRSNHSLSSTLFGVFNNGCYSWRNAETHFQGPVT